VAPRTISRRGCSSSGFAFDLPLRDIQAVKGCGAMGSNPRDRLALRLQGRRESTPDPDRRKPFPLGRNRAQSVLKLARSIKVPLEGGLNQWHLFSPRSALRLLLFSPWGSGAARADRVKGSIGCEAATAPAERQALRGSADQPRRGGRFTRRCERRADSRQLRWSLLRRGTYNNTGLHRVVRNLRPSFGARAAIPQECRCQVLPANLYRKPAVFFDSPTSGQGPLLPLEDRIQRRAGTPYGQELTNPAELGHSCG